MSRMHVAVALVSLVLIFGCAAPTPTGPTPGARLSSPSAIAIATPLPVDNPAAQCAAFTGTQYRGVCQAAVALQCSVPGNGNAEQCDRLRVYISRDVAACERILWLCPDGYAAFRDETGCGCKVQSVD